MRVLFTVCVITLAVLLGGCASTKTQNHYYTLAVPAPEPSIENIRNPRLVMVLQPVKLPVQVDRSQMVLKLDEHRVQVLETHRWSQPLKYEISQALVSQLTLALPEYQVYASARQLKTQPDAVMMLEILQFDSAQGVAATVEVRWTIQPQNEKQVSFNGYSKIEVPVTGDGLAALVEAHAAAISEISRQVAAGFQPKDQD